MKLLYICDLTGEWLDFIYTFSQLLPDLAAEALGRYVLCGVWVYLMIVEVTAWVID